MQERAGCAPRLLLRKPGNTHRPNKESDHHHCHHKPTELGWRMHRIPAERHTPNRDITQGCGSPPAAYSAASGPPWGTEGRGRRKPPCNQHKPVCCCALGSDVPPHLPLHTLPRHHIRECQDMHFMGATATASQDRLLRPQLLSAVISIKTSLAC
jgi:hypothetical protein